ncbi:biliverdin-producing heme oxygenase [Sanguibacter inulinus]|uniref:Biliverdin-producing heme oxygenase n=1 Tax=Sanguibacter inulinus TaxID=60922 RepID=A0A853EVU4_9MICO|nr:biliverdin-producing heme oxygenase [Sanguibacter inulinus]MBF0723570.1 biliverdin-producing heme oxygenase [Sanguibacter inulinus]NYS94715.1 biliverdin-producing heme oxygenase [Sanguibacter inulinus]
MTILATDRPTLSSRLREGTREEHESAESSGFISRLMSGGLSVDAYVALASQQFFVYSALEAIADDVRTLPQGSSLLFDELTRTPSIARDLEHLVGPDWRAIVMPLPATVRYVEALEASATSLPRYAAHAYTRYLGDLSGGQIIKRMLERHYGLGPEGITFYSFEEIPKSKPFKDVYRERLDGLELDEEQLAEAVAEAKGAFRLNQDLFADLGAQHC